LHAEAETKERDSMFPGVTRGVDFAFSAASPKTTGDKNACHIFQLIINAFNVGFCIDEFVIDSAVFARGGMGQ
jgi:hypothetical protein